MNVKQKTLLFGCLAASSLGMMLMLNGCGNTTGNATGATRVYGSTGTTGDYADWTISGSSLTVAWKVTTTTGTVAKTFNATATCGAADATYGYKTCTIDTGSCTAGTATCGTTDGPQAGSSFKMIEVPGVALLVQTGTGAAGSGGAGSQLHVGIIKDTTCSSIAGDYTYITTGRARRDLFGMYRTDATLTNVTHADFLLTNGGTSTTTPTIGYTTGGGTSSGTETLGSATCDAGVREIAVGGGGVVRMTSTTGGLFILDLPSGQGGLVAFKTSNAATLEDFAGKSFAGVTFPDNAAPVFIAATTGASDGSSVPITTLAGITGYTANTWKFKPATNTTWEASGPAFPNFTTAVAAYTSLNALAATYPNPSTFPGLFAIDGTGYSPSDSARVILGAMKVSGKVVVFGVTYNHRSTDENGGALNNLANSGNFLLFER